MQAGVDAFWPDEGDWFNLFERIKRFQLYYQGSLSTTPNVRPWSLQRNGFPGIAQWGGWVWSGDTESSWRTLEAQIAVGLNYSLSIGPSARISQLLSNREKPALYTRWFQFAHFADRSGRGAWQMRLPWSGAAANSARSSTATTTRRLHRRPAQHRSAELGNPAIEPIAKRTSSFAINYCRNTTRSHAKRATRPAARAM